MGVIGHSKKKISKDEDRLKVHSMNKMRKWILYRKKAFSKYVNIKKT